MGPKAGEADLRSPVGGGWITFASYLVQESAIQPTDIVIQILRGG